LARVKSVADAKRRIGIGTIRLVRKILVNTSANDWKVTGVVREWVYKRTNPGGVVEADYFDIKLQVPGHDMGLAPGLLGGYYEKLQLGIFEQLSKESRTIIDVGANIGLYSLIGAKASSRTSRLIAFEPIPDNVELFKRNIKLNKNVSGKITVVHSALGEDDRQLEVYLSKKSVGNHSVGGKKGRGYGEVIQVPQTSLDQYVKTHKLGKVDLVKIDVEGYDGYVLKGALKTLKIAQPALMVECIPKLLANCDFDYRDFGKILFDNYKYCYSIDEANGLVERVKRSNIKSFLEKLNDTNLVLVNRPEHKRIVESFIKS